jgi:uncharacterized protein (TIGR02246 family)
MKTCLLILGLIVTSLFTACGQHSVPGKAAVDPSADASAIRTSVGKFVDAWNKADSGSYSPMIAADAILIQPDGSVVQGRDAIAAGMAKDYDTTKSQQTATVDEVIVMGDHAYGRGTWNLNPTAGADTKAMNGGWSVLFQRGTDGMWLISRWMANQASAP